jgi:hypothetical protein
MSGHSLPNYSVADKRADRANLRKLCDSKGLESLFRRRGGNNVGLGSVKSPGSSLSIMPTRKKLVWMTGLSNHF